MNAEARPTTSLSVAFFTYAAASLFHYGHNGAYLASYPNLPAWFSPAQIYGAWLGVMAVGVVGFVMVRRGSVIVGPAVLAVYGLLGLDGLGHYAVAPPSAHTLAMNAGILAEAATGLLLTAVTWSTFRRAARARLSV